MDDFILLGDREMWGGGMLPFGLSAAARRQHLAVTGGSGTGKTTLLLSMFAQDAAAGRGATIIDPHGDLSTRALTLVPRRRVNDVIYFAPGDLQFPVGFNPLANVDPDCRHLVTSALVSACQAIWRDSWGPRLAFVLSNSIAALCEVENVSLLCIPRMLTDARYRDWIARRVSDPLVRRYWLVEFALMDTRLRSETISPILNKIGALLLSGPLRNVLGQVRNSLDISAIMDRRKLLVADLSKGRLGEGPSALLGALLTASFYSAALWRADRPEQERVPHFLYVDEFQNFAGANFTDILSEARKYALAIAIFNQHWDQMPPEVRDAVAANAANTVTFRASEKDAEMLARRCGGFFAASTFSALGNHAVIARLLSEGEHGDPFLGRSRPLTNGDERTARSIINYSRIRYGTPRHVVEERLRRWMR